MQDTPIVVSGQGRGCEMAQSETANYLLARNESIHIRMAAEGWE